MFKKLSLTSREIGLVLFSLFCLILTFISFSTVNRNNSKIEKLLTVAEKESSSSISIPLESTESDNINTEESKIESENISASWNEETQTFESPDGKLVFDKIEIVKGYNDKPILKVSFTITNATKEEKNVLLLFSSLVNVQQRNKNTSNSLQLGTLTSLEKNHLNDTLNADGTISGFYPVELENETDPIIFDFQYDNISLYEWEYELN
ncbi:TPA: DUF5067 domain-containing protein [Streptococcus suis]